MPLVSARAVPEYGRPWGLRAYLTGLIALVLLPVLGGAAFGISFVVNRAEGQYERSREQLAMALAAALDGEIERVKPMMQALAHEPEARAEAPEADRRAFHDRLRRLAEELGALIWVQRNDPERPWLMVSSMPFGTVPEGPLPADLQALLARAAASGQPELDNLVQQTVATGEPAVRLVAPILDGDRWVGAIGVLIPPEKLLQVLQAQGIEPPEFVSLVDGALRVVASSQDHERKVGRSVVPGTGPAPPPGPVGTFTRLGLDGTPVRVSYARLPSAPSWVVGIAVPETVYSRDRAGRWTLFGAGALGAITLGLMAGSIMARHLVQRLSRVTAGAELVANGQPWPAAGLGDGAKVDELLRLEAAVRQSQERLLAETQLARQREALVHSVAESTTYAIFVKDLEGRYQLVNRAAAAGLRHAPEDIIGRTNAELLPEAAALFGASDRIVLETGQPGMFEVRVPDPTAGSGYRVWQAAKTPWRDPRTGQLLGIAGVSRDITEEIAAAAALRESQQLLQTLARRATINAMASGMAHELSQPLTAAANYLHVAATLAARDGSAALASLRLGQEQVGRAGAILRQVRQFLRRDDTERQLSVIGEVVQDAMHLAIGGFDGDPPIVAFHAEPDLPMQRINPVQIQQVVINLVRNACEALAEMPPGTRRQVSVRVERGQDGGASVTIEDNGPGMPAEILASLFEPFRSTKEAGSGIGLAICRAIVESHGGRIAVDAAPGGGTRVRFTLPDDEEAKS